MTEFNRQKPTDRKLSLQRSSFVRRFIYRDKMSVIILLLAAVVGVITGLLAVAFDNSVLWIQKQRVTGVMQLTDNEPISWLVAFTFSALLAMPGYYLVCKFAPEAAGSGIPEIEGALEQLRPVRWWRVIPVKFVGGAGTLGAGMVLGREGPTVQMGGNVGRMVLDIFRARSAEASHTLLATGAAAGLAAAFNAPLAGILFIIEEMRAQFRYSLISIKAVFIGVIMSTLVFRYFNGDVSVAHVGKFDQAPIYTLWLYLILGILIGIIGVIFNSLIFRVQDMFAGLHTGGDWRKFVLAGGALGGGCGILSLLLPTTVGGGFTLIPVVTAGDFGMGMLLLLFIARMVTTLLCFGSGAPGGVFAPMLALGMLLGTLFGSVSGYLFPQYGIEVGTFAIAGMGALFAATVRAPLTGIILVLEVTDNYQLILPMIITCLGATIMAQFFGGKPLYSEILSRTLQRQQQAMSAVENHNT